jgi:radical SAM protein with 4Fe4S-binding SPASM domain
MVNATRIIKNIPLLGKIYSNNYCILKHAYHNFLRNSGLRPGPLMVSWVATNHCDSKCVYCEARANEASAQELTTTEIKNVLDQLNAFKVRRFFVIGGEPLMRMDLFEVLAYAKQLGMEIGIFTNSLRFKKYQQEIEAAQLQHIWTSIDGLAQTHDKYRGRQGAYDITMAAVGYYTQLGIPVRVVNTVVHPGNFHEMPALFERIKKSGATWWRLGAVTPVGRALENEQLYLTPEEIKQLFRFAQECSRHFHVTISEEMGYLGCYEDTLKDGPFYCHAGQTFCAIMPDGNVVPCQTDDAMRYTEGNVREQPFRDIWKNGFKAFRYNTITGECAACEYRGACCGGCWLARQHGAACAMKSVGICI